MGSFLSTSKDIGSNSNTTTVNIHRHRTDDDDDVYLIHRRDAMMMTRSASNHSKAAKVAYARGDHLSAQRSSRKAQEDRAAAKRLHAGAAKKILSIKNHKNDQWTLDLHGLHADEAVQALQKHLQKIEPLVSFNNLPSASRSTTVPSNPLSLFLGFLSFLVGTTSDELPSSSRRSKKLLVITGRGNHSRGEAKLPAAIRTFLIENDYGYDDESRPGVIIVRPKFRRG